MKEKLIIVIEKPIIKIEYDRILKLRKRHEDTIEDIIRKRNGKTIIFLKNTPKGWWLAVKLVREYSGKLHILNEVGYMDIPSRLMELSFERRWKPEYESEIKKELEKWGLRHDGEKDGGI